MKIPDLGGNAMPWGTVLLIAFALFGVPLLLDVAQAQRARNAPPPVKPDLRRHKRKEKEAAALRNGARTGTAADRGNG